MDNAFRALGDDETRQIGRIVETLEQSAFAFLPLEFGELKLAIGKGQSPMMASEAQLLLRVRPPHG